MTDGSLLPAGLVSLPLAAAIAAFLWPRHGRGITLASAGLVLLAAVALVVRVHQGGAWTVELGGWAIPLGIGWTVDGLSAGMLLLTAAVASAGGVFHARSRGAPGCDSEHFWPLWLFLWGCLNALFLSADLFNLYVTLEFAAIASVGLIGLAGDAARAAAWRYLLATLLGSSIYLLGVALLYGRHATLDIALLSTLAEADTVTAVAALLVTLGLLLKAAIFPLHFWLPAAHGRATPAVSAILSGVVVAAAYYLLLRLWLGPFALLLDSGAGLLLGMLGAGAVVWGGIQALLQRHLKLLVAYSTIAQLGYVLILFPLLTTPAAVQAGHGAALLLLGHGLAKAALFLAAGALVVHHGHDRLHALTAAAGTRTAWAAFALAAASLVGLPPTAGFVGKWWAAQAALDTGALPWVLVLVTGTLLTAAYLWRPLQAAAQSATQPATEPAARVPQPAAKPVAALAWSALALAAAALALGLSAPLAEGLLHQRAEPGT